MRNILKNKKGMLGLDSAKAFVIAILILAVLAFIAVIVMSSLIAPTTLNGISETFSGSLVESLGPVNHTGTNTSIGKTYGVYPYSGVSCSITSILNSSTNLTVVPANNYTVSSNGCTLTTVQISDYFNNSNWYVNYTYSYRDGSRLVDIGRNTTGGITGFFSNSSTWFALLSVVIIIGIIGLVIYAVNRFGSGAVASSGVGANKGYITPGL